MELLISSREDAIAPYSLASHRSTLVDKSHFGGSGIKKSPCVKDTGTKYRGTTLFPDVKTPDTQYA